MTPTRALTAAALAVTLLAACGDPAADPSATTATTVARPATSTSGPVPTSVEPTATTTATTIATREIRITVTGNQVTGGGRHKVPRGSTVRIVVTTDVADEVHLHGYDKKADLTSGVPGAIEVVADVPGVFEVELEKKHKHLAQLEVS